MNPIQLDTRHLLGFRIVTTELQQHLGGKIGGKVGVIKES